MKKDCLPPVAMVLMQLGFAGMNVVSKLALDTGMSPYVLISYRNLIAAAFIAPFAFVFERWIFIRVFTYCAPFGLASSLDACKVA
jgi:hypothetical protein